jgi:hypothetical protein
MKQREKILMMQALFAPCAILQNFEDMVAGGCTLRKMA